MALNLYQILKEVVIKSNVDDAINNRQVVIITYSDEENRAPEARTIEPYDVGITKAGNEAVRAFQWEGDTYRGIPEWKLFRLDRITSWQPTSTTFNKEPIDRGFDTEPYNPNGDGSLSNVSPQVRFDDNETDTYEPTDLNKLRKKTEMLRTYNPASKENNITPTSRGAIKPPQTYTNIPDETPNNNNPYQGAITNVTKNNDYWADYDKAEKEQNKQNKKNQISTKRKDDRWDKSSDTRKLWRKGALNNNQDEI